MKLKELLNNEKFLSKYGDYETVGDLYMAVRENDKLQLVFNVQEPKPKSVWDLKSEDECWTLDETGGITNERYGDGFFNDEIREFGNVFLTEKEILKEKERRKVETLLLKHGGRRWFESDKSNYILYLDTYDDEIDYMWVGEHRYQGTIYFASEDEIIRAIGEIGEERIKKALFEVR